MLKKAIQKKKKKKTKKGCQCYNSFNFFEKNVFKKKKKCAMTQQKTILNFI